MNDNILHRSMMGGKSEPLTIHDYMTIEALEDGLTASLSSNACEYCIDGSMNWVSLPAATATPAINAGQTLSFRATGLSPSTTKGIGTFTISHKCNLLGNCMAMLYGDNARFKKEIKGWAFLKLFYNCKHIISVSENFLPAEDLWLRGCCYQDMFSGCTSLTVAPKLPATTIATACYDSMFEGCTSLTTAPELPATTLEYSCYGHMFEGCTSLTTAPELPATTLAELCYTGMFKGCTALTTAPELPATTLAVDAVNCYESMFEGCTTLTTAPELPATTLTDLCYCGMFNGCTSLTTAPELPATTLALRCYAGMFKGCTALTTAPELPVTTLASNCYYQMFQGCTSLITAPELPATTLAAACYSNMFFGCTALTTAPELPATTLVTSCYSSMFNGCTSLTTAPALPATTLADTCYSSMFKGCTSLTTAPTTLPATTLASNCYNSMFFGCTALTTAPELPATTLVTSCYSSMFNGCTSLTTAPALPATTLAEKCYYDMFVGCSNLTTAPTTLPATTLAERCYFEMFRECTSLITAPELPATIMKNYCYYYMFYKCKKINYIKMLATDISATSCLGNWVSGVASRGTFVKNINAKWDIVGKDGIPSGWVVKYDFDPIECLSLSITADDVGGKATNTTVYYTAVVRGIEQDGNIEVRTITGTAISDEFPQNTSETTTITRVVSFTYLGKTATTSITQGVWPNSLYTVVLNNQWQLSSNISNPDATVYDGVYESFSNKGTASKAAIMYIDIFGYSTFQLYIRSYAESNYDYVMVSQLDQTINNNTSYSNTTLVKAHTRTSNSGTAIGNYKLVEFTGIDGGSHRITVVYRKDSGGNQNDDRGYVLIPKNQ